MRNIKYRSPYKIELQLSSAPDALPKLTVSHEWGHDVVLDEVTSTSEGSNKYSYTIPATITRSCSTFKAVWSYKISTVSYTETDYFNVYRQYSAYGDFFDRYPGLEDEFGDSFDFIEERVRYVINSFCGQTFEPEYNKTIYVDGNGKRHLGLGIRLDKIISVNSVAGEVTTDLTDYVKIDSESNFYLKKNSFSGRFNEDELYSVVGDWGWPYVPNSIVQASILLINDDLNDDDNYRKHGVNQANMDTHTMKWAEEIFWTTGNLDVDALLLDYTRNIIFQV